MKKPIRSSLLTVLTTGLVACGGGGGGAPNAIPSSYSISGFAEKGTLKNALVEVYLIDASGSVSSSPVKTGETGVDGTYDISALGTTAGQRYMVKIRPKADGSTVHVDEILGNQTLPSDFLLTAMVKTNSASTVVGVTPFSHMVVEAAKKASGGLTPENISKAETTVSELLGFNPSSVTKNDGSTEDARKMRMMLTAVAQMAKDGATGCSNGDAGERTKCVVNNLAAAVRTDTLKLEIPAGNGSKVDVSSAFSSAINITIQKSEFQSQSAGMAQALAKLNCGDNCTPVAPVVDTTKAEAIAKVKAVINEIRTDITTLFSKGGATSTAKGKVNLEAFQFKQAFDAVKINTDQMNLDLQAIGSGLEHYRNFKQGNTKNALFNTSYGDLQVWYGNPSAVPAISCGLYEKDTSIYPGGSASNPLATAPDNANYIACTARYARKFKYNESLQKTEFEEYAHGFSLTPEPANGSTYTFKYTTRARRDAWVCNGLPWATNGNCTDPNRVRESLQKTAVGEVITYQGAVVVSDSIFSVSGDLAPGFSSSSCAPASPTGSSCSASVALLNPLGKDSWSISVSMSTDSNTGEVTRMDLSGNLSSLSSTGAKLSELNLADGSYIDKAGMTGNLTLSFTSYTDSNIARLTGSLVAESPVSDKNNKRRIPGLLAFSGGLSNTVAGISTEFINGSAEIKVSGYSQFDSTAQMSKDNTYSVSFAFKGGLTAPNQPKLELVFESSGKAHDFESTANTAMLTYNRWVAGSKSRVVGISLSRTQATISQSEKKTASISEASSGLTIAFSNSDSQADVKVNSEIIGKLNLDKGLLTFSDGSIVSIDLPI